MRIAFLLALATCLPLTRAAHAESAKESVLWSFCQSNCNDGQDPQGALVFDSAGNLYGATSLGGSGFSGTIFELSPVSGGGWSFSVLYSFQFGTGDGNFPNGSLILDRAGNLYGTTSKGGTHGQGTVFELSPSTGGNWTETILYNFGGFPSDGQFPVAGLVRDQAGNLYGTTYTGGITNGSCAYLGGARGCGIAFELSPLSGGQWTETILHSFQGGSDGYDPESNLVLDGNGNLYGTTLVGGESGCQNSSEVGCGTVFQLSRSGNSWTEKILYSFQEFGTGGKTPAGGVILDAAGNLFGATEYGGYNGGGFCGSISVGCGVVFELSPSQGGWTETIVHSFRGSQSGLRDGALPTAGLSMDRSGRLYGTTNLGGNPAFGNGVGDGTAFRLTLGAKGNWIEAVFEFAGGTGGANHPDYPIIPDAAGNVYGVSFGGPANNPQGVAYQIAVTQ